MWANQRRVRARNTCRAPRGHRRTRLSAPRCARSVHGRALTCRSRVVPGAVSLGLTDPCTHAIGHVYARRAGRGLSRSHRSSSVHIIMPLATSVTPDTHARLRSAPREVVHFNLIGISLVSHWYLIGISLDALLIDVNVL